MDLWDLPIIAFYLYSHFTQYPNFYGNGVILCSIFMYFPQINKVCDPLSTLILHLGKAAVKEGQTLTYFRQIQLTLSHAQLLKICLEMLLDSQHLGLVKICTSTSIIFIHAFKMWGPSDALHCAKAAIIMYSNGPEVADSSSFNTYSILLKCYCSVEIKCGSATYKSSTVCTAWGNSLRKINSASWATSGPNLLFKSSGVHKQKSVQLHKPTTPTRHYEIVP